MDRPSIPRLARVAAIAVLIGTASCAGPRSPTAPSPIPAPRREGIDPVDRVVRAHNGERERRGLSPLVPNPELEAAALEHARDMAARRTMAHRGGDGSSPVERMRRHGYDFGAAAENVAYGYDDVDSVMLGWMRSRGHRRNILGPYSELGVGRAIANDGVSYWCVTFGTPATR